jgi:hypothetical protein
MFCYIRVPNTFKIEVASNLKIKVALPKFYWPFYIFFVFGGWHDTFIYK